MHFAHLQRLWWLVAVAALGSYVLLGEQKRRSRLADFVGSAMMARLGAEYSARRASLKIGVSLAALACLVVALAGPQWGTRLVTIERRGIDVVLAVDCSSSMNAEDVKPSRLAVAKRELGQLATELDGNRLGLVGFAGTAFSFCPLTLDVSATQLFLDQLDTNAMPVPGTSLGDAIHTSMQSFPAGDPNKKVILLLTDGEDHHSDPLGAAKDAARAGIVIDTVGIGNSNGEPIPETLENGQSGFVRDASGQVVMSRLDEASLKQIAKLTGGIYTHVDGTQADALAPVVAAIGGTERHRLQETVQRRHVERFQVLLLAAIVLLGLERWMTTRRSLKGQL